MSNYSIAQTSSITHTTTFSTSGQSMWGAGGNLGLNNVKTLFHLNPGPFQGNVGSISTVYVPFLNTTYSFGGQFSFDLKIDIGSTFEISGFENGSVDVNLPVDITHTYPSPNTFNKGEWITINSDFTILNGANITTHYPTTGTRRIGLYFNVGLYATLNANICMFNCTNTNLFNLTTLWPARQFPVFEITNTNTSPDPNMFSQFGITGNMALPNVSTTSSINGKCLTAKGEDEYIRFNLEVFKLLSKLLQGEPATSSALNSLSNNVNIMGVNVNYTIFTAYFSFIAYNKQRFKFCPNINTTHYFPTPVKYKVRDPLSGFLVKQGFSDSVEYHVGYDLEIKYPCNYEKLEVKSAYAIDENEDNFTNYTYDSLAFSFDMAALSFGFFIPATTVFPGYHQVIHVPYRYPCPTWSNPFKWCRGSYSFCICFDPITIDSIRYTFPPVWSTSIPLGAVPGITWINESWPLKGFSRHDSSNFASFFLIPKQYLAQVTAKDVLCKYDSTGSLTVNVTNGTPPYTYEYDNFVTTVSANNIDSIINLNAGTHYVKVTDANGCVVFDNINISEPDYELQLVNLDIKNVSCFNGNDGKVIPTVFGGTTPYTFNWSNGSTLDSAINLQANNYSLTITDSNNCRIDTSFIVSQPDSIHITASLQHILCRGAGTGSISLTVSGGSYPYSYLWNTGDSTATLSQIPAGVYTVTVTDRKGCIKTKSFALNEPATNIVISNLTVNDVSCFDGNNGDITVTASGGTGSLSYQYFDQNGLLLSYPGNIANNLSAGIYSIIITDNNGCTIDTTVTVSEPAQPLSFSYSVNNVNCYGDATGSISVSPTGGTPPYSYSWNNGSSTQNLSGLTAGIYTLTITDANGCIFVDSIEITQPELSLTISDTLLTNVKCYGQSTGLINTTINGGTTPYQILWNNGETSKDIDSLSAGNYTITVTDSLNCILTESYNISEPAAPLSITESITNVNCYGDSSGAISVNVQGGTPGYAYQWATQDSVIISNFTPAINNLTFGNYTILVTDSNGCQAQENYTVTQPQLPLSATLSYDSVKCYGNTDGNVYVNVSGGSGGYQYLWNTGATSQNLTNVFAGWYSVVITDTKGCIFTDSIYVAEPAAPLSAFSQPFDVPCYNGNLGKIDLTVSGGTPPYQYLWSNGETTQNIDSLTTGIYTVTVTDVNGCTANSGAFVNQPAAPLTIAYTVDSVSCFGYSNGHINISISGGTMPYHMQWADSLFLLSQYGNDIYNLQTGYYDIIVTDGNGCLARETIFVPQPDSMTLSLTTTPVLCYGDSSGNVFAIVTGGTAPYNYLWNDSSATPFLNNVPAGYYSLTVSDVNNCVIKNAIEVLQPDIIYIDFDITEISCQDNNDGEIYVQAHGGVGNFIYQWANGEYGQQLTELSDGEYTVVVTDGNNCTDTLTLTLYNPDINCIDIPNSITPNGDGINDTWIIDNIEMFPNAVLKIYNQWGVYIYETTGNNYIPWDGTYHNEPLPSATYYYILDLGNGTLPLTGPINIIR